MSTGQRRLIVWAGLFVVGVLLYLLLFDMAIRVFSLPQSTAEVAAFVGLLAYSITVAIIMQSRRR